MNIGVCGYYGMGNFGDDLFLRTFQQIFNNHVVYPWNSHMDPSKTDRVIIGGGDLITPYSFHPYYFPKVIENHPTWVYGVGIVDNYPEETWPPDQVEKYRSYISKAKSAAFRDQRSADIAIKAGFHASVRKVQDIVFAYTEKHFPIKRFSSRPTIGICVFSYPSYPFDNMVKLSMHLIQKGYHIVFIPVINHPSNIYSDYQTCENMVKSIKKISPAASAETIPLLMDLDLTYNYIQSMDYLISYKLHPSLVALRAGKPVFALSQMNKVKSLLASFGMDKYMCDYQLPYEEIQSKVDMFLKESTQVIQKYESAIRSAEKESLKQILALKKEIESRKATK